MLKTHRSERRSFRFEELETRRVMAVAGEDSYESNNSILTASQLGLVNGSLTIANLAKLDTADWFAFTIGANGTTANFVQIAFNNAAGNLDLQVYAKTTRLVGVSNGNANVEKVSLNGLAAGTYYVRVFGKLNANNSNYTLSFGTPAVAPPANQNIDLIGAEMTGTGIGSFGYTVGYTTKVSNLGTAKSGSFKVEYYLSRNKIYSADDVQLTLADGSLFTTVNSLNGGATTASINVVLKLPAVRPAGWIKNDLFIVMRTDAANTIGEKNENNNAGQLGNGIDHVAINLVDKPTSEFNITLKYNGGLTYTQRLVFAQAAARWSEIIVGDLPDEVYNGIAVDDLRIDVRAPYIDGVGSILGQAGPDRFRAGSQLPYHGSMEFDSADLAAMEADGSLYSVILHEMGHVLGIGTLWGVNGFIVDELLPTIAYIGDYAVAEYNEIFLTDNISVPVENTGGPGTRGGHWRESVFRNEVMTGYLDNGSNPISRITVGSLKDIGYTVNMGAADVYFQPLVGLLFGTPIVAKSKSGFLSMQAMVGASFTGSNAALAPQVSGFAFDFRSNTQGTFIQRPTQNSFGFDRSETNVSTLPHTPQVSGGNGISDGIATRLRNDVFADMEENSKLNQTDYESTEGEELEDTVWDRFFDIENLEEMFSA